VKIKTFLPNTKFSWFRLALVAVSGAFLFSSNVPVAHATTITPPRLELEGDPGTTVRSSFKVINDSESTSTLYTEVENFEARDETGNPQFVQTKEGLSIWIDVEDRVSVAPGEEKEIPFSIQVPRSAEPGGYFASIFVRNTPPSAQGREVSVGAKLGVLILFRVNGEIQEGVDILEFSTRDNRRLFTSLPIEFYYRFQNTGADRVKPEGDIIVKNVVGLKAKILSANRTDGSVLPRSIRRFESAWIHGGGGQEDPTEAFTPRASGSFLDEAKYQWSNFAFGMYTANLDITFGQTNKTASGTFRFLVIPWQLLIIVGAGLIAVLIALRFVLRRYNRYIISRHQQN
jgi:hypothetical protein